MASIQTRNSVLAIVKETTEGVLKKPTLATQYIALQDGFSMEGGFDLLENAELKASIGTAKPIIGGENPTASLDHYLRHSGVEGQEPSYGVLLEASLGAKHVNATEYDTVSGSTVSVINVGTGEGATFERGDALLIKDAVHGFRIRCIDGVAADVLNLGFHLPAGTAPAAGVNLGKCVLYKPANTAHPTVSLWHYLGQGGALQAMAGGRVTSASFDITAGDLINASYSIEGVGFFFDPVEVVTGSNVINIDVGGGNVAVSVPVGLYKTPIDLAAAVLTSLQAGVAGTYTFIYNNTTGRYTITKSTGTMAITWASGSNSIGATLGFTANDTGALSYTSDVPLNFASPQNPSFDTSDPLAAKDNEVMIGVSTEQTCFKASTVNMTIDTPKADILSVCAASGKQGSVIQSRAVTITVSALLQQYNASEFEKFRTGAEVQFQYSFGQKLGGNWIAGKCGALYCPTATISSFAVSDSDGLAQLDIELSAFVNNNGAGEVYVAFV